MVDCWNAHTSVTKGVMMPSHSHLIFKFEVILLCLNTELSGFQGLLLWLIRYVGTNCRLESDLSVGSEISARHLKTNLFRAGLSDSARTFEFVLHLVGCVTISG